MSDGAVQVTLDTPPELSVALTPVGAVGFDWTTKISGSEVMFTVTDPFCVARPSSTTCPAI